MGPLNARQMEYALRLARVRNFSQVAEELKISQPALSKQILQLESELGVKLFDRNTNPLTLTPAGEDFVRQARELLYREDQLLRSMDRYRSGEVGELTIGVTPFRSAYLMPAVVARLRQKFPGIRVRLAEYGSDVLRREMAEGRYDLAVVNLPVDDSVLEARPLEQDRLVLVLRRDLLEQYPDLQPGRAVAMEQCADLPFVVVGPTQEMRQLFDRLCARAEIHPVIAAEVVGLTTVWDMACAGVGAAVLPLQFVERKAGADMVILPLRDAVYFRQVAVVTRRGQYLSAAARYAMDLLEGRESQEE